jgi:hypothetical protein
MRHVSDRLHTLQPGKAPQARHMPTLPTRSKQGLAGLSGTAQLALFQTGQLACSFQHISISQEPYTSTRVMRIARRQDAHPLKTQ